MKLLQLVRTLVLLTKSRKPKRKFRLISCGYLEET